MNVFDIANGHFKEVFGMNEDLSRNRLQICHRCLLYSSKFGGICNDKLYMNPNTGEISTEPKDGYKKGCSCRLKAKTRLANAKCPLGKW